MKGEAGKGRQEGKRQRRRVDQWDLGGWRNRRSLLRDLGLRVVGSLHGVDKRA